MAARGSEGGGGRRERRPGRRVELPMWGTPEANEELAVAVWDASRRGPVRQYKGSGRGSNNAKRCLCCFPSSVAGQEVPLPHGVVIVLCPDHRDPRFIASRGGRDFLAAVSTMFQSLGLHDARRHDALTRFVRQVTDQATPTPRRRPGSHAWPELRASAEEVWSDGGSYHEGERVILKACLGLPATVNPPSPHTIRRWWRQRRWISRRPGEEPPPTREPVALADTRPTRIILRPADPDDDAADNPASQWHEVARRRGSPARRRAPPRPEG